MRRITVLLAEDNTFVRREFRKLLETEADIKVVGEAANGKQAIAMVKKVRPDVVLLDVSMPILSGLQANRPTLNARSSTKILMLSAHADDAYIEAAFQCGAVGYLFKHADPKQVCVAIRESLQGILAFSPSLSKRFSNSRRGKSKGGHGEIPTNQNG